MPVENIRELINKLLALSNSPNEHEANAALEKAQELLEKYNIDTNSLKEDERKPLVQFVKVEFKLGKDLWRHTLANAIATTNFCAAVKSGETCVILGRYINVQAVIELIKWILPQVSRLANISVSQMPPYQINVAKKAYLLGISTRIFTRLKTLKEHKTEFVTALIVSINQELNDELNKMFGKLETIKRPIVDNESFRQGYNDGSKVSVSKNLLEE
jgi:hypothetical protein